MSPAPSLAHEAKLDTGRRANTHTLPRIPRERLLLCNTPSFPCNPWQCPGSPSKRNRIFRLTQMTQTPRPRNIMMMIHIALTQQLTTASNSRNSPMQLPTTAAISPTTLAEPRFPQQTKPSFTNARTQIIIIIIAIAIAHLTNRGRQLSLMTSVVIIRN